MIIPAKPWWYLVSFNMLYLHHNSNELWTCTFAGNELAIASIAKYWQKGSTNNIQLYTIKNRKEKEKEKECASYYKNSKLTQEHELSLNQGRPHHLSHTEGNRYVVQRLPSKCSTCLLLKDHTKQYYFPQKDLRKTKINEQKLQQNFHPITHGQSLILIATLLGLLRNTKDILHLHAEWTKDLFSFLDKAILGSTVEFGIRIISLLAMA